MNNYTKRIGLVAVDNFGTKKKWGATIYPNIALAKIARYYKTRGCFVEWALPFDFYDIVYKNKIFNFTPDDNMTYNADCIIKGGTGYDLTTQLPSFIDKLQPDYSIYPNLPKDTAYGFLTRGCINSCPWCVVPKKEGYITPYMDCEEIAIEGRHKLVLMDNNILAAGDFYTEQLNKIIANHFSIDFNQAMDARLVTEENARLLAKISWIHNRIRFGCDTHQQIDHCEKAMSLLKKYGFRGEFFLYIMLGKDFDECYNRLSYWWHRSHELRELHQPNVYPFAQPYRDPLRPNLDIPQCQKDMAAWVNKHQVFQLTDFEHFSPRKGFFCSYYLNKKLP